MQQLSAEFWIQMMVYAATFGIVYGQIKTQLTNLEKKVEKHNNMVERVYVVEESVKSAHRRIDEIRED